jgi:hypothetical protein
VPSCFHPHLASASRALLPPLRCCSCVMLRTVVQATEAAAHASPASPPRAMPWHRATGHQAVPARSHQSRVDIVRPCHESIALSTPHLRPSPGPVDRAMSFASSPCCSPTMPAPTSAAPPAPHRRSSPLDVRRREAVAVVSHSPPRCLQSVHLDIGVLRGHFPHYLAPLARRISAAAVCARRRARA